MNKSITLTLILCSTIDLHAANSLPKNICQLYNPNNPTETTRIITYNENTFGLLKGNKYFGFDTKKLLQFDENSLNFGSLSNTLISISQISELVSGGKVECPKSSFKYYPVIRFLLFKINETRSRTKDFLDRQEKKIQKLADLSAVRNYLFEKNAHEETLIIDLVAWLNHKHGEDWKSKLSVKCISCPNETFRGYKNLTKPELQAWEKEHKKCTIQ